MTSTPIASDNVLTTAVIVLSAAGTSRVGRVHGVMTLKKIGSPRYEAASTRSAEPSKPGSGPSHATRESDWLRGSHRDSTAWNADIVKPAAEKSGDQSGVDACAAAPSGSICDGIA